MDPLKATSKPADTIERIPTGIQDLDLCISGGIPRGMMTVLAGKSNGGKSTIASQIIAEALDCGHKVLWYAGETSIGPAKDKLIRQIAGPEYIYTKPHPVTHQDYYRVYADISDYICNFYAGKIDYFRPGSGKDVLQQIEQEAVNTGSDVVIIDNLMSLTDRSEGNDLYSKQSAVSNYLASMAERRDIYVILLVHVSTKLSAENSIGQGAIKGASEIAQYASLILTIAGTPTDKISLDKLRDEVGASVPVGTIIPIQYDQTSMLTYAYRVSVEGGKRKEETTRLTKEANKRAFASTGVSREWEEVYYEQELPKLLDNPPPIPSRIQFAKVKRAVQRNAAKMIREEETETFLAKLKKGGE